MINLVNNTLRLLQRLDPQIEDLSKSIEGKALGIKIVDILFSMTLEVKNNKLIASKSETKNTILGNTESFVELFFNKNMQQLIIDEKIEYNGSLTDLKKFYEFFESIDIDLIYYISQNTHPQFASAIEKPAQNIKNFMKDSNKATKEDIKFYLTEESKVLISNNEMNIFNRDLKALKQDIDRLEAKINLLRESYHD